MNYYDEISELVQNGKSKDIRELVSKALEEGVDTIKRNKQTAFKKRYVRVLLSRPLDRPFYKAQSRRLPLLREYPRRAKYAPLRG